MQSEPISPPSVAATSEDAAGSVLRPLLYRWFVEYNPLYLLSATLVLAGCILWSKGLVHDDSLIGPLGIAGVAEVYAASLIGGAALLTRIGLRRPAVMLALLFVLYQWDTTLHTETCAYLGRVGPWATAVWFALFIVKLHALAWALRVRLARHLVIAAIVAAAGLALGPHVLPVLGGRRAGLVLAGWLFALVSFHLPGGVTSAVPIDAWGATVLRRATRVTWALSGALVGLHVAVWGSDHQLWLGAASLAIPLAAVPRVRREGRVWLMVSGAVAIAALAAPWATSVTALLAAIALSVRALAPSFSAAPEPANPTDAARSSQGPYRAGIEPEAHRASVRAVDDLPARVTGGERERSFVGALFAAYVAMWTFGWSHGAWPAHIIPLDVALGVVVAVSLWRTHARVQLIPLAICYSHLIVQSHIVPVPTTSAGWGESVITLGFALLAGSLFASYRLRAFARGVTTVPASADQNRGDAAAPA